MQTVFTQEHWSYPSFHFDELLFVAITLLIGARAEISDQGGCSVCRRVLLRRTCLEVSVVVAFELAKGFHVSIQSRGKRGCN